MSRFEDFRQTLLTNGQSFTKSRSVIFNQLLDHNPVSAAELATICEPAVDRATTYRSLQLFERLGIIKRVWMGFKSRYELTDQFSSHHHHLQCTNCKRVINIENSRLEKLLADISQQYAFTVTDHQVEISGLCKNCR